MTTKKPDSRGPAFATGGLRKPRVDLVEWPVDANGPASGEGAPPSSTSAPDEDGDDVHAELARAKREIRRLLGRVQELSEENERLRREALPRSSR